MIYADTILSPETITAIAKSLALELYTADIENPLYMSQNKAFGRYGVARVKRWILDKKIRMNNSKGKGGKHDLRFEDLERCAINEEFVSGITEKRKYKKKTKN
jgi:hypothetical protein